MAYTHYFERPINSEQFEEVISQLPKEVYRVKGILQFSDTDSRFLFQYALPFDLLILRPHLSARILPDALCY
jgi:G3E family GTPase